MIIPQTQKYYNIYSSTPPPPGILYVMNIFVYISICHTKSHIHIAVLKNQCDIIYNSLLGVIVVVVI